MKTIHLLLGLVVLSLSACGSGGPATRVGRGVDRAFYKAGQGIESAGRAIERTAR